MHRPVALALFALAAACDSSDRDRQEGQTSFESAPPIGNAASPGPGGGTDGASGGGSSPPISQPASPTRTVEETDLYRLEGTRLYYLNSYRGLMVFDVSSPDHPTLLGRSPIFGTPVDMIVRNGVATVVIGDWFGRMDDGTPFHGSIVRGIDASDPAHIRVLGEAKLGGWVRDDRVVGDVIYAVSEDYGWSYGWDGGASGGVSTPGGPSVIVSSVSFAGGAIRQVDRLAFTGFTGVFNVTASAILLASAGETSRSQLLYLDISDPGGTIAQRGSFSVEGRVNGWGPDNGRWNLDFADGKTAHVLGQLDAYTGGYALSTVDFSNPAAPALLSNLQIPRSGWSAAARFDTNRLYLSPDGYFFDSSGTTPIDVFDLSVATAPRLAGSVSVPGEIWNLLLAPGSRLFALGNDNAAQGRGSPVTLHYLDVSDPAAPRLLGTAAFGQGWAWTPAAGTFKAFTMDVSKGLVVVPFAGWDIAGASYNNGLQLIEFTPNSLSPGGMARTKGWVERGIFVGTRLLSLSDLSIAVVDYTDPAAPSVVNEVTLARNVVTAQPNGGTIAEVSSDWWDYDTSSSEVRVLPIAAAEETADGGAVPAVRVDGVGARVFASGTLQYIVTAVLGAGVCPGGSDTTCPQRVQQVQVVDISSGAPVLRGKVQLPADPWGWYGWGWEGFWWYDWWWGDEVVQVGGDALAFRRWEPVVDASGHYIDTNTKLYIVDVADPDAPRIASVVVQTDPDAWWGNMKVVGDKLYSSHYDWTGDPRGERSGVRYFLDAIDLRDRAHPRIGARINVPGLLVGGSPTDSSIVYTIDYRWYGTTAHNELDVLRIQGSTATLMSHTAIDGWVGSTFFQGNQAYLSAQQYSDNGAAARVELHAIDLSNPTRPRDRVVSDRGWGWLLAVAGDRALVTSGWGGSEAIDVYRLRDGQAPAFEQTVRSRGWSVNSVSRQDQTLFLSSGYWGVQAVPLQ